MEWLDKRMDSEAAVDSKVSNLLDIIEPAQFKWVEDISQEGKYKLIDKQENKVAGSIDVRNGFIKSASCKIFNRTYRMKKKGLFDPRILINENNNEQAAIFYYYNWKGDGELLLNDGEKYFWEPYDSLNNEWIFYGKLENELVHFKPITSFFKSGYYVDIKDENINQKTLSILIMLGAFNLATSAEEVSDDAPIM
jgi:hypothetical protein